MSKKKWYAVIVGRKNKVIVETWAECEALVTGFSGAIFKSFTDPVSATQFIQVAVKPKPVSKPKPKVKKKRRDFWDGYPCTERGDYLVQGVLHKNRCIRRKGPTLIGENYQPTEDASVPWDE
jgi:ribonuclease HI